MRCERVCVCMGVYELVTVADDSIIIIIALIDYIYSYLCMLHEWELLHTCTVYARIVVTNIF